MKQAAGPVNLRRTERAWEDLGDSAEALIEMSDIWQWVLKEDAQVEWLQ